LSLHDLGHLALRSYGTLRKSQNENLHFEVFLESLRSAHGKNMETSLYFSNFSLAEIPENLLNPWNKSKEKTILSRNEISGFVFGAVSETMLMSHMTGPHKSVIVHWLAH